MLPMDLAVHKRGRTLEISEIRITLRDDNKLRGFASITLDNAFVIRGLKIGSI